MQLDGVPHCIADFGDRDIVDVYPLGVAMAEGIGSELFTLLVGIIQTFRLRRY